MIFPKGFGDSKILTTKDKTQKEHEALKKLFDSVSAHDRGPEEKEKMLIYLGLLNGSFDPTLYENPVCFEVKTPTGYEEISFDYQNFSHTPLIAANVQTMLGEKSKVKFDPQILDLRPNRNTIYKRSLETPVRQYFERLVQVTQASIMQKLSQSSDISQIQQNPEVQAQIMQQAQAELQKSVPPAVFQFLNGEYTDTTQKQANKLLKVLKEQFDLKLKTLNGLKYAYAFDEVIFFAGDWNGRLEFREENNINVIYGCGVKSDEWIQHSDWVRRRDWMSYTQLVSAFSPNMDPGDLKILEDEYVSYVSGKTMTPKYWGNNPRSKELMWKYSQQDSDFKEYYGSADIKTQEGQDKFLQMQQHLLGSSSGDSYEDCGIQVDHVCIRLPRKMYRVKRRNKKTGNIYFEEYADHYTPTHHDIDVQEIRRDQIWEGWGIGSQFEKIWTGIRPLPCQYQNPNNYDRPDMPYYGRRFSSHQNTTKTKSMIGRATGPMKMFDTVLAKIKMDMATDIGPVFMMFMNLKPKDWKYQEWLDFIRNAGIMWIDPKNKSMNGVDPQFLKEINLSKMGSIAANLQLLDYWKSMVAMSMFFDEARGLGFGQYMNKENVEQSQQKIYNKTAYFEEQYRVTVEKALAGFLNRARHWYKKNLEKAAVFLDDVELKELETSPLSHFEWFGIQVKNSEELDQKLKTIQNYLLSNNQSGRSDEASIRILCAENESEITDILRQETKRISEAKDLDFKRQQDLQNQKFQADALEKQQERAFKLEEQARDLASKERRTAVDSQKYRMANDVDMNQQNDFFEQKMHELKFKYEELKQLGRLKEAEIELKRELKSKIK